MGIVTEELVQSDKVFAVAGWLGTPTNVRFGTPLPFRYFWIAHPHSADMGSPDRVQLAPSKVAIRSVLNGV
jgi:hypothetical protein